MTRLLDLALLEIETLRAGLSTLVMQQLVLLGTFFILPVYLQTVLGLDAFETGKRMVPMSVAMLVAALLGPRLAARFAPRRVAQAGLLALTLGAVMLLASIDVTLERDGLRARPRGVRRRRWAARIPGRQHHHVVRRAGEDQRGRRLAGHGPEPRLVARHGLDRRDPHLGPGRRVRSTRIEQDDALPADLRVEIAEVARTQGLAIIPVEQAEALMLEAGVDPATATIIADDYAAAQLDALRVALGGVALFAVLALWFTRKLPMTSATTTPARSQAAVDGRRARCSSSHEPLEQGRRWRAVGHDRLEVVAIPKPGCRAEPARQRSCLEGRVAGRPAARLEFDRPTSPSSPAKYVESWVDESRARAYLARASASPGSRRPPSARPPRPRSSRRSGSARR